MCEKIPFCSNALTPRRLKTVPHDIQVLPDEYQDDNQGSPSEENPWDTAVLNAPVLILMMHRLQLFISPS